MNSRLCLYIALCLIVVGFSQLYSSRQNTSQVQQHKAGDTDVTVIKISTKEKKQPITFYMAIAFIASGLVLAAANLKIKDNNIEEKKIEYTRRETEIIEAIRRGLTSKEIAQEMNVSLSTIKSHTSSIYRKTGVNSRSELLNHLNV